MHVLARALALLALTLPTAGADTIYVDADLTTGADDGSSWQDAYRGSKGLRVAVAAAEAGDRIFATGGLYRAGLLEKKSIQLKSGVAIYGGFLGVESDPDERPPLGTTWSVVDGDLDDNDDTGSIYDNTYQLFTADGVDETAILDGFYLTRGNASGNYYPDFFGGGLLCWRDASPTIRNCVFASCRAAGAGGGVWVETGSHVTLIGCRFERCEAIRGGGVQILGRAWIDRCTFEGNEASTGGALSLAPDRSAEVHNSVFFDNTTVSEGNVRAPLVSELLLVGCTIAGNRAGTTGAAGLWIGDNAQVEAVNTIVWSNTGPGGSQLPEDQINGIGDVTYSLVMGGYTGTGNSSQDPRFEDLASGDLRLRADSPAIDAGDNDAVVLPYDLERKPRRADDLDVGDTGNGSAPLVDMGAIERALGTTDPGCDALANSAGTVAVLSATGSVVLAVNDLRLAVHGLPSGEPGYFLMSDATGALPLGSGLLCLGQPLVRFSKDVLDTGGGAVQFVPDLTQLPSGTVVQVGEFWHFQFWHRDGASSNFSTSLGFVWE